MKKLTQTNIEELANEIMQFLDKYEMSSSTSIYYNNKVVRARSDYNEFTDTFSCTWITEENIDPHDYFEYCAYDHILSMSFEGVLYDVLNYTFGRREEEFRAIFEKYNLYTEMGNSWNLSAYPIDDDMEIEYTKYKRPKETIRLYRHWDNNPSELQEIMDVWYELSKATGDKGSCCIGAGFEFEWEGDKYFMSACSPWQGSISWETHTDAVREMLEKIGATNIYYKDGNMD